MIRAFNYQIDLLIEIFLKNLEIIHFIWKKIFKIKIPSSLLKLQKIDQKSNSNQSFFKKIHKIFKGFKIKMIKLPN